MCEFWTTAHNFTSKTLLWKISFPSSSEVVTAWSLQKKLIQIPPECNLVFVKQCECCVQIFKKDIKYSLIRQSVEMGFMRPPCCFAALSLC